MNWISTASNGVTVGEGTRAKKGGGAACVCACANRSPPGPFFLFFASKRQEKKAPCRRVKRHTPTARKWTWTSQTRRNTRRPRRPICQPRRRTRRHRRRTRQPRRRTRQPRRRTRQPRQSGTVTIRSTHSGRRRRCTTRPARFRPARTFHSRSWDSITTTFPQARLWTRAPRHRARTCSEATST